MSDIKQAIAELRGLIDNEPVETALIHSALDALSAAVDKGGVDSKERNSAIDMVLRCVASCPMHKTVKDDGYLLKIFLSREEIESIRAYLASPTPSLTERIEKAAEEIAKDFGYFWRERPEVITDIAAIIRRNLEVKQ